MIQKVRSGEELNKVTLKDFLVKKDFISNRKSKLNIEQFSNGFSNLTYLIQIENKELVYAAHQNGQLSSDTIWVVNLKCLKV